MTDMASVRPILAYWEIRVFGQLIRNLLVLAGVDFVDKRYVYGPGSSAADMSTLKQQWYSEKLTLGLDFPNLPYYMDGEVKLTQTVAVLKYLARKYGFIAKDNATQDKQEMLEQQPRGYQTAMIDVVYPENFQELRADYEQKTIPDPLDSLNKYLGDDVWFLGQLSYVDCLAYETLDFIRIFSPSSFDNYPKLCAYLTRFESLSKIKAYQNSSKYKRWPIWSKYATWGYQ